MPFSTLYTKLRVVSTLLTSAAALSACSSGGREPRTDVAAAPRQSAAARPAAARPLINLPAALAKRAAGFGSQFGKPRPVGPDFVDPGKAQADDLLAPDSLALFEPQGLPMIVSFQPRTGAVQDVLLLGPDEATLMRQATLLPNAPTYLLLPVFDSRRADHLLGLRVVPKQQ